MRGGVFLLMVSLLGCDDLRIRFADGSALDNVGKAHPATEKPDAAPASPGSPDSGSPDSPAPLFTEVECAAFPTGCPERDRPKCTLISAEGGGLRSACTIDRGELLPGAECERARRGDDNCVSGAFCSALGGGFELETRLRCQTLCAENSGCGPEEHCLQVEGEAGLGTCVADCDWFAEQCDGEGLRCALAQDTQGNYNGHCEIFGAGQEGAPCVSSSQCAETFHCALPAGACRALCSVDVPCADDRRCLPLKPGDPLSPRLCVP